MRDAIATKNEVSIHRGETAMLAKEMADSYEKSVQFYQNEYKLTRSKAEKEAIAKNTDYLDRIRAIPADKVADYDLRSLHDHDPAEAVAKWGEVKTAAVDELESGVRSATLTNWETPYERAQFLAIRHAIIDEWRPAGGLELTLIDQMANCHSGFMYWLKDFERLKDREVDRREIESEDSFAKWNKTYLPPRVGEAEYVERALKMADRYQRMFMRSLRALRDLRRYTPRIMIHNQGQVNIGQQQVNQVETGK